MATLRVKNHPILGVASEGKKVWITVDGRRVEAYEGEPIAAAILAAGIQVLHYTQKYDHPRGVFCAIGRCTDCIMTVNGQPNVRTCVTPVEAEMKIETQRGLGNWEYQR